MGVDSDGSAHLANGNIFLGDFEALDAAVEFSDPGGGFEPEGDGLGVDGVRSADAGSVDVFLGELGGGLPELLGAADQDSTAVPKHHAERGVDDVVAGHAEVNPAAGRSDVFFQASNEGDEVVPGFKFDFVASGEGIGRLGLDRVHVGAWDDSRLEPGLADGNLCLQPAVVLGLAAPNRGHFRRTVAVDHA